MFDGFGEYAGPGETAVGTPDILKRASLGKRPLSLPGSILPFGMAEKEGGQELKAGSGAPALAWVNRCSLPNFTRPIAGLLVPVCGEKELGAKFGPFALP
jgi:hypothetical protein